MIQRYEPVIRHAEYTHEEEAQMKKDNYGGYVSYSDYINEVTKLQERITELKADRDGHYYGDA